MNHITLRQLRGLAAIHAEGTIVNASRVLGLTGPALTLQLQQVEAMAGAALFERTNRGMRPTDAGRAFVEAAHAIEDRLRQLRDDVEAIRGGRSGTLALGVVSTAKYFAPQLIAAFARAHTGIAVKLLVGNRAETISNLADYKVDVALMGRPPQDLEVRATVFGEHPLVIISAPDHPLATRRRISRELIARERFLVRELGSGTRMAFERFLGDLPGRSEDPGTEMGSNETIKQAVMAGMGIAFISAHTVAMEVEADRLRVLDVEGLPVRREWYSVVRADRAVTPAIEAFLAFLADHGASHLPAAAVCSRHGGIA